MPCTEITLYIFIVRENIEDLLYIFIQSGKQTMSCTKDSLYIFLQSGKYTVLYKRFTIYIYTVRKNATSCTMDSLTVVLPTMRAPIILGV